MDSMTHTPRLVEEGSRESAGTVAFSILIVDGAMDMRAALLCRRLRSQGYHAEAVASGRAALRFLEERPVDLVLLGASRPGMNVLEVLRRLRDGYSCAALPVIMMTVESDDGLAAQALRDGANDWVPRDADFPSLFARLEPQLEKKRRHDELRARHDEPRGHTEVGGQGPRTPAGRGIPVRSAIAASTRIPPPCSTRSMSPGRCCPSTASACTTSATSGMRWSVRRCATCARRASAPSCRPNSPCASPMPALSTPGRSDAGARTAACSGAARRR